MAHRQLGWDARGFANRPRQPHSTPRDHDRHPPKPNATLQEQDPVPRRLAGIHRACTLPSAFDLRRLRQCRPQRGQPLAPLQWPLAVGSRVTARRLEAAAPQSPRPPARRRRVRGCKRLRMASQGEATLLPARTRRCRRRSARPQLLQRLRHASGPLAWGIRKLECFVGIRPSRRCERTDGYSEDLS